MPAGRSGAGVRTRCLAAPQ
uniref:Uncharacterized protein n=1 Tax=Anguilla anguilla TaxID=7936 RepID=A0A0E9UH27_ANGAN